MTGYGLNLEIPLLSIDSFYGIWIGIVEEYLPYAQGGTETGIALVLRQKGRSKDIFERASGCPPISIYKSNLKSLFARQPMERKVYLQHNGATTALSPSDCYKTRWPFFCAMPTAEDSSMLKISEPMLVLALSKRLGAGTKISSIYPPVARYYYCPVVERPHKGGLYQSTGNKEFFFVLSIPESKGLVVHVQVQFGSTGSCDYVKSFKVRIARYEHNMSNRFGRDMS